MTNTLPLLGSGTMKIFIDNDLCIRKKFVQVRFPKTKKKRIRRKWSKNINNWKLRVTHHAIKMNGDIYISLVGYETLIREFGATKKELEQDPMGFLERNFIKNNQIRDKHGM